MKNVCFFVLVLLCFATSSNGQLRIAALGGPHAASVNEENSLPGWETTIKPGYDSRPGLHLGVLVEAPLSASGKWFFQPGVLYQAKGRRFFMRNDTASAVLTDTVSSSNNLSINYIEIPLNLAYKIRLSKKINFLLSAGPYIGLFYNGKQKWETRIYSTGSFKNEEITLESGNSAGKVRTIDIGMNARVGFEIGSVLLTGFASKGLTDFYTASYEGSFRHQVIGASLGFWLNKTKKTIPTPKDTDKDGVPDNSDGCPTLPGAIALQGCPDKDGDGITDPTDNCPDIAGKSAYKGCPVPDTDGDGLNDEIDACPQKAGTVEFNGCPIPDSDGDGITDPADNCPDVAGKPAYKGCPVPDSDGDGLNDETDACPQKAGTVEFNGCPIPDSDGDGLNDKEDKCPSEPGTITEKGCPEIKKKLIEKVNFAAKHIFFGSGSDELVKTSYASLNEVAEELKANPSLKLTIEGHTDSTGSVAVNKELSGKRATAVLRYLEKKGIEVFRLSAIGYGSEKPVDSNLSPEGRARNRRVELRLMQ